MSTNTFLSQLEDVEDLEDLENLLGDGALDIIKSALRQRETSRLAHKTYYLKRQAILQKAKDAGLV